MKLNLLSVSAFLIFSLYAASNSQGQVVINEFSCSNLSTIADNYGNYDDWIELYNPAATPANIGGFHLSDNPANPAKYVIPAIIIPAGGRQLFYCSGLGTSTASYYHTNFKLTQTKYECILFTDNSGTLIDSITTFPTQVNHSRGRTTDGASTWSVFLVPTPGNANTGAHPDYEPRPQFSLAPGFYTGTSTVAITCADPSAVIRFTLNGSTPTPTSSIYSGPLSISSPLVIRAVAFSTDPLVPPSFAESNTYFMNVVHQMATVSVFGDRMLALIDTGNSWLRPETGIEYFDASGTFRTESYGSTNKHGNDSWAYGQRGIDFVSDDVYGYSNALHYPIFTRKTRDSFKRVILKAAANDNYPSGNGGTNGPAHIRDSYVQTLAQRSNLHMDCRTWEPCVLYVNGRYWGVYDIREKVDDNDYTNYYYDQDNPFVEMLQTWGGTWSAYGGTQAQTDWNTAMNYITNNDMSVTANYNYADSIYNIKSLTDYMVLNSYVVCSDWLNWNTMWWRGLDTAGNAHKWKYCLWDEDATFGHYINYTGVPTQQPTADPCNPQSLGDPGGQGHVPVLDSLLNSPIFRQYYVSRFIDLHNTTLNCTYMQHLLDSMIGKIQPEMQRQCARWGGTVSQWQTNVQDMKTYITNRCAAIDSGLINCYQLSGPYPITYIVDPPGAGNIQVNSIVPTAYPFSGNYFGGITVNLQALSNTGNAFIDWTSNSHPFNPNADSTMTSISLNSGDTIVAHFSLTSVQNIRPEGSISMRVYPSVTDGKFILEYENKYGESATIDFYSVSGKHALSLAGSNSKQVKMEIDPSQYGLSPGMYFVSCSTASGRVTQKIVFLPK